jgi:hypothetical protein
MTRQELLDLRTKLIRGDPPYTVRKVGPIEERNRSGGVPGLDERAMINEFDANASGVKLALQACLALTEHLLERLKK